MAPEGRGVALGETGRLEEGEDASGVPASSPSECRMEATWIEGCSSPSPGASPDLLTQQTKGGGEGLDVPRVPLAKLGQPRIGEVRHGIHNLHREGDPWIEGK